MGEVAAAFYSTQNHSLVSLFQPPYFNYYCFISATYAGARRGVIFLEVTILFLLLALTFNSNSISKRNSLPQETDNYL